MRRNIVKHLITPTLAMLVGVLSFSCAAKVRQSTYENSQISLAVSGDKQFFNKDKLYTTLASTLSAIGWELAIAQSNKDLGLLATKAQKYGSYSNPMQYWDLYLQITVKLLASLDEKSFTIIVVPTKYLYNYRVGSLTKEDTLAGTYQSELARLTPAELSKFNANDSDREDLKANQMYEITLKAIAQALGQPYERIQNQYGVIEVSR